MALLTALDSEWNEGGWMVSGGKRAARAATLTSTHSEARGFRVSKPRTLHYFPSGHFYCRPFFGRGDGTISMIRGVYAAAPCLRKWPFKALSMNHCSQETPGTLVCMWWWLTRIMQVKRWVYPGGSAHYSTVRGRPDNVVVGIRH